MASSSTSESDSLPVSSASRRLNNEGEKVFPPRLSDVERSVVLRSVFAIGRALALLFFRECATPPHVRPGTLHHVTQFYQAFPRVSTASDKRWAVGREGLSTRLRRTLSPARDARTPAPRL